MRRLIWGILLLALCAIGGAAMFERLHRNPPLPSLGAVPDFTLTNRDGRTVRRADLAGKPWLADFVFTRCGASCPMMSLRLSRLDRELPQEGGLKLVSFTVDPDYDTPPVLARYADTFKASDRWLFLTGPHDALYDLSQKGFKLGVDAAGRSSDAILHSTRFVLVDRHGQIRRYYDAFDSDSMALLAPDVRTVLAEK
ncbi:MAG TPA: SCO family protein [Thermoanaerobaculia bacterium]